MRTHSKDLQHHTKVISEYQIKFVRCPENHSADNTYISTSNSYQELSKDDDTENECNTGDYVESCLLSQTKPTLVK